MAQDRLHLRSEIIEWLTEDVDVKFLEMHPYIAAAVAQQKFSNSRYRHGRNSRIRVFLLCVLEKKKFSELMDFNYERSTKYAIYSLFDWIDKPKSNVMFGIIDECLDFYGYDSFSEFLRKKCDTLIENTEVYDKNDERLLTKEEKRTKLSNAIGSSHQDTIRQFVGGRNGKKQYLNANKTLMLAEYLNVDPSDFYIEKKYSV